LLARAMIQIITFYRKYLSSLKKQPTCRFIPTCSEYGLEAFARYGFFKGGWKLLKRILKCNPLGPSGYDPLD
jgi:uncharacterized protein